MKKSKISVVINTYNEEKNLARCLESIKDFCDEVVVVDMYSTDNTVEIARKYGAKIYNHEHTGFVEPARNFALRQTQSDWILLIDADEEAPKLLLSELKSIAKKNEIDYVNLPRKNIIFGKWIKHSRWWPDYNVRFFKKGKVEWNDKIHSIPITYGKGREIPAEEKFAIIHHNFQTISQYLERSNRYSSIMAEELVKEGYHFSSQDLIKKPFAEFLSRYYAGRGYLDGLHGLVLAILQAITEFLVYLKVWEKEKFTDQQTDFFAKTSTQSIKDFFHWQATISRGWTKLYLKIKSKI